MHLDRYAVGSMHVYKLVVKHTDPREMRPEARNTVQRDYTENNVRKNYTMA